MTADLALTAQKMSVPGKGILAADESTKTITKRFDGIQVQSTEENWVEVISEDVVDPLKKDHPNMTDEFYKYLLDWFDNSYNGIEC